MKTFIEYFLVENVGPTSSNGSIAKQINIVATNNVGKFSCMGLEMANEYAFN
jgi:hypothetical protein